MDSETLYCNGCSNSVTLRVETYAVEAECGKCGYRMTPEE